MKSTTKSKKVKSNYPILKVLPECELDAGMVVLFTSPGIGIVLTKSEHYEVGLFFDSWHEESFIDFEGKVILGN